MILNRSDLPGNQNAIDVIAGRFGTEVTVRIPMDISLAESCAEGSPVVRKYPFARSSLIIVDWVMAVAKRYIP